ncbi:MAG: ABC transporter permease [Polyangiales bacterium]|nr:ABC transporter permease [Myxococcales bacterium]MCB9661681.1 ABC transporter permease [Sandaracinaceae bacterium]
MLVRETVRTALRSLLSNRMRTALTGLGMVIGVAAVVAVLAIGEGAQANVANQIRALGANLLYLRPSYRTNGPVRSGTVDTLTLRDAEALARLPGVTGVSPEAAGSAQVKYLSENMSATIYGVTPAYFRVRGLAVDSGLSLSADDVDLRRRVVVLGANVADALFQGRSPLGQRVQLRGITFRVLGVLTRKGDTGFSSPDDQVFVPLSTHQSSLFGQTSLSGINVQIANEDDAPRLVERITQVLRARHRLSDDMDDDFTVRSQAEMLATLDEVTTVFKGLLGSVAAVSLLVGGIGIMNIMLVSVRERTREIGVRMAVGARRRDILLQFLVESVVVSIAGGLVGVLLGVLMALGIARVGEWPPIIPVYGIVLALGVSVTIGLVFGVGPARRAARLDPVAALRTE